MTTAIDDRLAGPAATPLEDDRRRALLTLGAGVGFGLVSTALFWRAGFGLNFFLWTALAVGANAFAFGRRALRPMALGAMGAALVSAWSIVRFEGDWALVISVPATLALLAVLPVLLRDRSSFAGLARLDVGLGHSVRNMPRAAVEFGRLPGSALGAGGGKRVGSIVKGLAIGVPIAGLFAGLFAADKGFARAVRVLSGKVDEGFAFAACALVVTIAAIASHLIHTRVRAHASPVSSFDPYRVAVKSEGVVPAGLRMSALTWSMILGQVILVFALFVAANARYLFGGEAVIRGDVAVTYASYLHSGFGQLLVATVLAVCLVLAGHVFVAPRSDGGAGRTKALVAMELMLVGGAFLTLASCYQRLSIYQEAYGASSLRLGVALVEAFVAGILALTAAKSLLPRWRGYASSVLVFTTLFATLSSHINADAHTAMTNLDRAERGRPLDVEYFGALSEDAAAALHHPYVLAHPEVEASVRARVCTHQASGWRAWRGMTRCR